MELLFDFKILLLTVIMVCVISYHKNNGGTINTEFSFNLKDCKFAMPHFWKTFEENMGKCFQRCHHVPLCVSISYNLVTKECLGYQSCSQVCVGQSNVQGWMNYCQGGLYNFIFTGLLQQP